MILVLDDDDDDNEVKSTVLRQDFFPWQCRINSLAICSMLNLEAAISTVFATFWNHFYGNCSILELETHISAGIGNFWS